MLEKHKRFAEEYIIDLNATQAAKRAGYSAKTAYSIGSRLLKEVEVIAHIKQLLQDKSITAEETVKLTSDIARGDLKDFMVIKQVLHIPRIKKSLKDVIKEKKEFVLFEEEFAVRAQYAGDDLDNHKKAMASMRLEILRLEMELERNPKATRIVDGEAELVESADLDLAKLARAKEAGRIKSISHTMYGPKVELYAADTALQQMAKLHGLIKDKVELSGSLDFLGFLMESSTTEEGGTDDK